MLIFLSYNIVAQYLSKIRERAKEELKAYKIAVEQ